MGGSWAPWAVGVGYLRGGTSSHESPFSLFIVFYFSHFFFFISTYFRYSHFFSTSKKKYIYIIFPLKFFSANISFFLSSLSFKHFFFLYLTMIFLSLILLISTFFLYLHLCFLRLTIPPLHTKCYRRGFLYPLPWGGGGGGNGSVTFVSFEG